LNQLFADEVIRQRDFVLGDVPLDGRPLSLL
jgi:hypothetical protein